jgi:hypothetical protein
VLTGVISLSLSFHGGVELAHVGGHVRALAKSHKSGVYDRGGVGYLSCARGSSPVPARGYVMACATFYERGFGMLSHQFLHSLL